MTLQDLFNFVAAAVGAVVNIEILDAQLHEIPSLKIGPQHHYHHGSYCQFAKISGNQHACSANKIKSLRRARNPQPFSGCCPFGVWDYAHPVHIDGSCVAVIYLGHFDGEKPLARINGRAYDGPPLPKITAAIQAEIKRHARFIERFIVYACLDARRQGVIGRKQMPSTHYERMCRQFIQHHYHEPIRLVDLAGKLGVNANYLGHLISTTSGRSFRDMLTRHRIEQAKVRLRSEKLSITEIAYACGFQDSNYFAVQFHRLTGQTPTQFRRHGTPQEDIPADRSPHSPSITRPARSSSPSPGARRSSMPRGDRATQ